MRDPRKYPFGYFTGSSFVLASAEVFVWFESIEELAQFLHDVEPRVYDLKPGEGLEEYQAAVGPILEVVRQQGLTEELRKAVDEAGSKQFNVNWWGTFADLCGGREGFGREVLDAYLGPGRAGEALAAHEMEDFVSFVQTYGA
jgi:hypothetical protein